MQMVMKIQQICKVCKHDLEEDTEERLNMSQGARLFGFINYAICPACGLGVPGMSEPGRLSNKWLRSYMKRCDRFITSKKNRKL
jgi:uncharacterized protein YlaI